MEIDGANDPWTGTMSTEAPGSFRGTFSGDSYVGSFTLRLKGT